MGCGRSSPPHTPPDYRSLAERCWQAEPKKRCAAARRAVPLCGVRVGRGSGRVRTRHQPSLPADYGTSELRPPVTIDLGGRQARRMWKEPPMARSHVLNVSIRSQEELAALILHTLHDAGLRWRAGWAACLTITSIRIITYTPPSRNSRNPLFNILPFRHRCTGPALRQSWSSCRGCGSRRPWPTRHQRGAG